jgi:hypothetical protein
MGKELAPHCLVSGCGARVFCKRSAGSKLPESTVAAKSVANFSSCHRNEPHVEPSIMSTLPFWYLVIPNLLKIFDKLGVSNRVELLFLTLSHPSPAVQFPQVPEDVKKV